MQVKTPLRGPIEGADVKRDEWVAAVDQIVTAAEAWAREQNWLVHRGSKTITEEGIGTYDVPMLMMRCPQGALILDPMYYDTVGASGLIDLCAFPSYDFIFIIRTDKGWKFSTNPRTRDRPWSKKAFLEIASELASKR